MAKKALPSPEVLRQLLRYEPETGKLFWKERVAGLMAETAKRDDDKKCAIWNGRHAGREAFTASTNGGYKVGWLFGVKAYAHRVIYAMEHGQWPDRFIDHVDGDRSNNRIDNIRHVNSTGNSRNQKLRGCNSSGVVGVSWNQRRSRWEAFIGVDYRKLKLGYYRDFGDAVSARKAAEVQYGFHENHGRSG